MRRDRSLIPVDAFGRVLFAVLIAIAWTIAAPDVRWARAVTVVLFAGTVLVAFRASGVRGRPAAATLATLGVGVAAAILGSAADVPAVSVIVGCSSWRPRS